MSFPDPLDLRQLESGAAAYSELLAEVWTFHHARLRSNLVRKLEEAVEESDDLEELEIREIDLASPPELRFGSRGQRPRRMRALFFAPAEDREAWRLDLSVRVKHRKVRLRLRRLRVLARVDFRWHSPVEAELRRARVKVKSLGLRISASNEILNLVGHLLRPFLSNLIPLVARRALADALIDQDLVERLRGLGLADRPLSFPDPVPDLAQDQERVLRIGRRLAEHHLPWNTILSAEVSPDPDPEESRPETWAHWQDSAIWTGHYLAAEAFRHSVTGDPDALANLRRALEGVEVLLRVADEPGLLSRVAVPVVQELHRAEMDRDQVDRRKGDRLFEGTVDGTRYASIGNISRDQLAGIFLGIGILRLLVSDVPDVAARAAAIGRAMAGYLVGQRFVVSTAEAQPGPQGISTVYLLHPHQVMAVLQVARRLDEARFGPEFEKRFPMWPMLWFLVWLPSLDPHDSYFKFNLEHALGLVLLRLEDDAERREQLSRPLCTLRRTLRFHANAWFNLVELAALGDTPELLSRPRGEIEDETRHLVHASLGRPVLLGEVDLEDDEEVEKVIYEPATGDGEDRRIAARPVPVGKRPGTDFLWQRSPFDLRGLPLRRAGERAHDIRPPGVDQVLTYWMARWLGL